MKEEKLLREFKAGNATVKIYGDRQSMGDAAARAVANKVTEVISRKGKVSMVFASAPSQNEFLAALVEIDGIEWSKVVGFHLDEYIGLPSDARQAFGKFLRDRLFGSVNIGTVHYVDGNAEDIEKEAKRYAVLLEEVGIDIACVGIGENGHLAFNDPHVADFKDPLIVKVVEIDDASRQQQVNDGCFGTVDEVPRKALTLTIPAIFDANHIIAVVPGSSKAEAVRKTVYEPISTSCPASILRKHGSAVLFLDQDSAALL